MKKIFLLLVTSLLITGLNGQDITPVSEFTLNVDYAKFRYDDQSAYLEIYYACFPHQLTYHSSEEKYRAGVKLHTQLINNETQTVLIDKRVLLPVAINDTTDAAFRYPFTSQSGHALPFGQYSLKVFAADSLNATRMDSVILPITLKAYPDKIVSSDLELCSSIKSSSNNNDPFYKNRLEVVPNATLIFGVTAHPVVFYYLELYNLDPQKTYQVKKLIKNTQGKIIRELSKSRKYGVTSATEVGMTNVTSILSGKYFYGIEISDADSKPLTRVEKTFFIYNPHLQPEAPAELSVDARVFEGMTGEELAKEFDYAKYVATDEEKALFAQLDADVGKREFLVEFWTKILKGRLERQPINRLQYLQRVEEATEKYETVGKEGWQTDRGRVYILYGPPDDLERFPSMSENKPHQIWHYHNIESGVDFVFIDRLGFGNYILYHSTKRGELRDDNWRENLR
ncbi:GWxTD domain-containing protein [candidate division KSB1 bacterium]|nr:GWxTD domain-containing protein [candidate division KSB1 bacterium]